jgi:hypothetical protein
MSAVILCLLGFSLYPCGPKILNYLFNIFHNLKLSWSAEVIQVITSEFFNLLMAIRVAAIDEML